MATKYKQYFDRMLATEKQLFSDFDKLYDRYSQNQDALQEEFNKKGAIVLKTIHIWETKLCSQSEKAGYANFTTQLSEKFMSEVRKKYPLIDFIGIIAIKKPTTKPQPNFSIKKISLG